MLCFVGLECILWLELGSVASKGFMGLRVRTVQYRAPLRLRCLLGQDAVNALHPILEQYQASRK